MLYLNLYRTEDYVRFAKAIIAPIQEILTNETETRRKNMENTCRGS